MVLYFLFDVNAIYYYAINSQLAFFIQQLKEIVMM
jgi:hypothetical protein